MATTLHYRLVLSDEMMRHN